MHHVLCRRDFVQILAIGCPALLAACGKKEPADMRLRPQHLLDIINDYGHDVEFTPHPYGHAVHTVAQKILSNPDIMVEFIVGSDEICKPCMHLQADGMCADSLRQVSPPVSKQEYNDDLDTRVFAYLNFKPGTIMTVREYLALVGSHVPGIEKICTHPGEEQSSRLEGLSKGLAKIGKANAQVL